MPLNHTSVYSDLTDEHFISIGKIVVEWANIEFLLGVLLSRLLMTPEYLARSYTDRMSAVKLQEAIKEGGDMHWKRYNYKLVSKELLEQISVINNKITTLRATRNKFAHFCWSRNSNNEIFGTNFTGGPLDTKKHKRSNITFTLSELSSLYSEAYDIVEKLSVIIQLIPQMEEDGLSNKLTISD